MKDANTGFHMPIEYFIGKKYNGAEILSFDHIEHTDVTRIRYVKCKCLVCGSEFINKLSAITAGRVKSCGCLELARRDNISKKAIDKRLANIGEKIGKLTCVELITDPNDPNYLKHRWECECGNTQYFRSYRNVVYNLKRSPNSIVSCGCTLKDNHSAGIIASLGDRYTGETNSPLGSVYWGMVNRCYNTKSKSYKHWGGRGIYIVDEWYTPGSNKGYFAFKKWALSNGYYEPTPDKPSLSIDRIDNNGPYAPWNCRWATGNVQANNRTNVHYVKYNGIKFPAREFDRYMNIEVGTTTRVILDMKSMYSLDSIPGAVLYYNILHPKDKLYFRKNRWVDKEGFEHLLMKVDFELIK